eukprot:COSAG01_NODE_6890_length_3450_cov_1.597135_2_plen_53_part_00
MMCGLGSGSDRGANSARIHMRGITPPAHLRMRVDLHVPYEYELRTRSRNLDV